MAKNLHDALLAVSDIVGRVEGIRSSPEYPSEKIPQGIFVMTFPDTGDYGQVPQGVLQGMHEIGFFVYCARVHLPQTAKKLYPLADLVAAAIYNEPTLDGTVETYGRLSYSFNFAINAGTNESPTVLSGWTFTISDVKIEDETVIDL